MSSEQEQDEVSFHRCLLLSSSQLLANLLHSFFDILRSRVLIEVEYVLLLDSVFLQTFLEFRTVRYHSVQVSKRLHEDPLIVASVDSIKLRHAEYESQAVVWLEVVLLHLLLQG